MAQSADSVLQALKNDQYAPVYFLQGDETYYIDQITSYIEQNALSESEKGFNLMVMYGKETDITSVLNNARRFPMMAERQVVIVKEAQEIADLSKDNGQKLLESYITSPSPTTILVFCYKKKTLDGRKSLSKALDKHAILVTSKKLYDNQIPKWIISYIKEKGFRITDRATQMLSEYIGSDLERLANEIDKILINFDGKGEITENEVASQVGISKEYNVFELQKAIGVGDVMKANRIVRYFESNPKNNPIIPVISLLYSFFNKLLLIHHSKDKSEGHIARLIGVSPFFVKDYTTAIRRYSLMKVIDNIHVLKVADLRSKGVDSGSMSEGDILKEMVYLLMH